MAYTPAMKVLDCLSQTPVSPINKSLINPQAPPFLPDKMAGRRGAPRPPMTDVGTETAFRLEKAQAFPKK